MSLPDGTDSQNPEAPGRKNAFEDPGGNYPDAGDGRQLRADERAGTDLGEGPDHHGRDGDRDTVTVSQSQAAERGRSEQDRPAMSQNNADDREKLAGILDQTGADLPEGSVDELSELIRQRASQAGIDLSADDARRHAEKLRAR